MWTRRKLLIPAILLFVWLGINFYQTKVANNKCYEIGYLRGRPESIPCFNKEKQIIKEKFQVGAKQILIYIWNLGFDKGEGN